MTETVTHLVGKGQTQQFGALTVSIDRIRRWRIRSGDTPPREPISRREELTGVVELVEDKIADGVNGGLARVALDLLHRYESSHLAVPLEVLSERDVESLEDVHAGEVAAGVVVADDREAYALIAEVKAPSTQQCHGTRSDEAAIR